MQKSRENKAPSSQEFGLYVVSDLSHTSLFSLKARSIQIPLSFYCIRSSLMISFTVLSPGWEGEEDEEYGGAYERDWAVAAQRQTAAQREGRSAQRPGQFKNIHNSVFSLIKAEGKNVIKNKANV